MRYHVFLPFGFKREQREALLSVAIMGYVFFFWFHGEVTSGEWHRSRVLSTGASGLRLCPMVNLLGVSGFMPAIMYDSNLLRMAMTLLKILF
jgi:hypothetical protein